MVGVDKSKPKAIPLGQIKGLGPIKKIYAKIIHASSCSCNIPSIHGTPQSIFCISPNPNPKIHFPLSDSKPNRDAEVTISASRLSEYQWDPLPPPPSPVPSSPFPIKLPFWPLRRTQRLKWIVGFDSQCLTWNAAILTNRGVSSGCKMWCRIWSRFDNLNLEEIKVGEYYHYFI